MAISGLVTTSTDSITIGASGNDRIVLAVATGTNLVDGSKTFNGVAPTGVVRDAPVNTQACIYYWLDADLPVTAGTYSYSEVTGALNEFLLYAENVTQSAPSQTLITSDLTVGGGTGAETERLLTLSSGTSDDLRVFAMRNAGTIGTDLAGMTYVDSGSANSKTGYSQTDNAVGFKANAAPSSAVAALFTGTAPAYTITSIDGDNNVQAGQSNVDIVMTATTGVTVTTLGGETLTINGVT